MKQVTMTFRRDVYTGPACLEYSWVPEGVRRKILLNPGQPEGKNTDQVADNLYPSQVQVYRMNQNEQASIQMWQFPPGPPAPAPVDEAVVEVFQRRMQVVGIVFYTDVTSASGTQRLDPFPRQCPELPPSGKGS
jgi:hypothetical protein